MTFREWETEQYIRARSFVDPELDEPVHAIIHDLLAAGIREITSDDLYSRLGLTTADLDHAMRRRVGDAVRRVDWRKKWRNGPHASWTWVPLDRQPVNESDDFFDMAEGLMLSNSDLTKALSTSNVTLSEVFNLSDYVSYVGISALLHMTTRPRLKARAPNAVAQAAKTLLSADVRLAVAKLQVKLEQVKRLKSRGPVRTALPQAPAHDDDAVDFELDESEG